MKRRYAKTIKIGNIKIGGNEKIAVQSMLNVPSEDIEGNVEQAVFLENAGCDILRVAIPDMNAIKLIPKIKEKLSIPLVADIHFDYKLAIESIFAGIDKIRINPGNIGGEDKIRQVVNACREKKIPIRIGVNSGSLQRDILKKYSHPCAQALFESAMCHAALLEKFDFNDIVLSMKSSNVLTMIEAYELAAKSCMYPLHLGVTETGTESLGAIKSAIGIGSLLAHGVGDTIRVSLTAPVEKEISYANDILKSLGLKNDGVEIISCPTCGRTKINLIDIVKEAEERLSFCKKNIKVAIMGCVVNGPGEAKEADIGIAGGDGVGVIFKKGEVLKKVKEDMLLSELISEINKL